MRPQKRTYFFRRGTATRCDVRPPLSVFVVVPRLYFQVILVTFCPSSKRRPDEQYLDTPRVVVALTPPARSLLSYLTYCRHWPKIWQKMTQGEYFTDDEGSGDEARPPRPPRSRTRDGEDPRPPRSPTERNDADPIRNLQGNVQMWFLPTGPHRRRRNEHLEIALPGAAVAGVREGG